MSPKHGVVSANLSAPIMHYSSNTLRKYRDASYACDARIKEKEFWETRITVQKGVKYVLERSDVRRFDTLLDVCAGCSLNGYYILARNYAKYVIAVDKKFPKSSYHLGTYYTRLVGRMSFREESIYDNDYALPRNSVVMSIHPCRSLALRAVEIAAENHVPIVIVPCCIGKMGEHWIDKFNDVKKYDRWCMKIADLLDGEGYTIAVRHIKESVTPVGTIIIGTV